MYVIQLNKNKHPKIFEYLAVTVSIKMKQKHPESFYLCVIKVVVVHFLNCIAK